MFSYSILFIGIPGRELRSDFLPKLLDQLDPSVNPSEVAQNMSKFS